MCVHACSIEREDEYMFVSGCACMIVHDCACVHYNRKHVLQNSAVC